MTSPVKAVESVYKRPIPDTCLPFSSEKGKAIFAEALAAGNMSIFFDLVAQFQTQDEPAYCGLTTLVMVLNTFHIDPKRVWKGIWRWYHENMLECSCISLEVVKTSGINMDEFAHLAVRNGLRISMTRVDNKARYEHFRESVERCTRHTDNIMVVSFSRAALNQTGDGHFSPIGGYHQEKELVLILDAARYKYPPYWLSLPLLWESMKRVDQDTGLPRGYCILEKAKQPLGLISTSTSEGCESHMDCPKPPLVREIDQHGIENNTDNTRRDHHVAQLPNDNIAFPRQYRRASSA